MLLLSATLAAPSLVADPSSPFVVTVTDTPDPVAAGSQILYTITVVNDGGASVDDVALTHQLNGVGGIGVPPQLQITSSRGSCTQSTTLVTCTAGTMEGRGSWTVSVRGIVTAADGTVINNTVAVSGRKSTQSFNTTVTETTMVLGGSGSPMPDLTISKNGPAEVQVSTPMTYTLTVYNIGTAPATDVKVVDTVPAGLTAISASGTSLFDCSVAGQTVTCIGGAVNQGANATITINATAPAVTGTITNTAAVDPDDTIDEANNLNNFSALVNTSVVAGIPVDQLTIDITDDPGVLAGAGPDPVIPGANLTFKAFVTNPSTRFADDVEIVIGTQGLVASSVFVDQVITNGTLGNTGGCWVTASEARCRARRLQSGGTILMTVSGSVIAAAGSTMITTATVTGNIWQVAIQATDTELTTVKPDVDLTVTKSDAPDPVCASSWADTNPAPPNPTVCMGGLTYTFVVGNSGINPANGVLLRDPLPAGTHLDSWTAPAFAGGCSVDASNILTCTGGVVPPESTTTVTIVLTAPPGTGTILNTVTVDPNNAIFEADETNNTFTQSTLVITGIDLTINKVDSPPGFDPIATGGTQTYTITVDNIGPQNATNIRVRDTLPAGTIFRDVVGDNGFTCSHSNGVVECFGGSILGTLSEFHPVLGNGVDDTATIVIRAFAQPIVGTMHNEVRVDPLNEIPEANEMNNFEFEDTLVVSGGAGQGAFNQLTIAKAQVSPANPVARNAKVTYTITVGNDATDPAVSVTVRDFLPAGSTYIEATGTNQFLCSQVSNYINCVGGEIAAGGSATITVSMFAPDTPGTYTNQAIVDPDNAIPEGNEFDNQASVTTVVENGGNGAYNDLTILKTGTANTTPAGPIDYTLQVWNDGSDPALNVAVRDVLPAGVTFVSAADNLTGPGAPFTCSHVSGIVSCTGATINGGGVGNARVIAIRVNAPDALVPAPGLKNTATVDPDNTIPEGDEFNNTSSADTTVSSAINLTVTKSGPTSASQSQVTDYVIKVTNNAVSGGGQLATGVVMVDPLPVGLIPLAVDAGSGNNWACEISQNPINVAQCLGDLAPGDTVTIKITVFITAENGRPLDNTACVDPDDTITESNELDNCSQFGTFVAPPPKQSPNLLVSKQADSLITTPGAALTYTITASNTGDAKAQGWNGVSGLTVSDTLPSEVTFTNVNATNGWTCTEAAGTITCHDDGSGLDVGASTQITILTSVNTSAAIPIANTASAAPALVDTVACFDPLACENETAANLDNNTSTVVTGIGSSGFDLAIGSVTDVPDPVAPGHPLQYTVVAVNGGTATANNVAVAIDIPSSGVSFVGAGATNGFACAGPVSNTVVCVGNLPGGGDTVITLEFITLLAGLPPSVAVTATIDPTDVFAETNEGNNSKTQVTSISGPGCFACTDLVAAQLVAEPEPLQSGDPITLTFLLVNTGDTPTFLSPGQPLLALVAVSDGTVAAATPTSSDPTIVCAQAGAVPNALVTTCEGNLGGGLGVTITLTLPSVTGSELQVFAVGDPNFLVFEADDTNNILIESVVINP